MNLQKGTHILINDEEGGLSICWECVGEIIKVHPPFIIFKVLDVTNRYILETYPYMSKNAIGQLRSTTLDCIKKVFEA
jgi:hypothetical protein